MSVFFHAQGTKTVHGTVLTNGVNVAVQRSDQMFQKFKKKFQYAVCINIEWIWSKNEQVTQQSF